MCKYEDICWRSAYTKYFKKNPSNKEVPDRQTIMLDGFISPKSFPKGGIFAENMPIIREGVLINACPNHTSCPEYQKHIKKVVKESHGKHKLRRVIPKEIREEVSRRCRYKCAYCGVSINSINEDTGERVGGVIDHIIAISKGGTDDIENLTLACRRCNSDKSNKEVEHWELQRKK